MTTACSRVKAGGRSMNVTSVCQLLARTPLRESISSRRGWPGGDARVGWPSVSGPSRSAKATWAAESRVWARRKTTLWSSSAWRTWATASSLSTPPVSMPEISAPMLPASLVTLIRVVVLMVSVMVNASSIGNGRTDLADRAQLLVRRCHIDARRPAAHSAAGERPGGRGRREASEVRNRRDALEVRETTRRVRVRNRREASKMRGTDRAGYEEQVHVAALSTVVGRHRNDDARPPLLLSIFPT